jgi:hypothetical protein
VWLDPIKVVIEEQRAALRALELRTRRRAPLFFPGLPATSSDQARLVALGVRVLGEAAGKAEVECHRILLAAELQAAEIVNQAHQDVANLTDWIEAGGHDGEHPTTAESTVRHETHDHLEVPHFDEHTVPDEAGAPDEVGTPDALWSSEDEMGADFFASFAEDSTDRWSFMDDDNLVGVGPALVRRLLRRPSLPREHPVNE